MEGYRRTWERNEGMEEDVDLTCERVRMEVYRIKETEELRSFRMERYRRKWERKEGMEEDVDLACGRRRMEVYDLRGGMEKMRCCMEE